MKQCYCAFGSIIVKATHIHIYIYFYNEKYWLHKLRKVIKIYIF